MAKKHMMTFKKFVDEGKELWVCPDCSAQYIVRRLPRDQVTVDAVIMYGDRTVQHVVRKVAHEDTRQFISMYTGETITLPEVDSVPEFVVTDMFARAWP